MQGETTKSAEGKTFTSVKAVGVAADRNARYRRTMEDAHVVLDGFAGDESQGYFAIYDGHGGRQAVEFVAKSFHINLEEALKEHTDNVEEAWKATYKKTDEQIKENNIMYAGTTTVTALVRKKGEERWLYVANAGDARAVLCRAGTGTVLTYEHKASDESEASRVLAAGGFITQNRVNGILAVTRSLGDCAMKAYVLGDPYTSELKLEPTDTHLILACDGLWDVCNEQEAVELVKEEETPDAAAKKLLIHALKNGSTDNISVMVIVL
ncbi:mgpp2cl-1, protein phosphatase 2C-like protein 1 [Balamuthia mandrillaris]